MRISDCSSDVCSSDLPGAGIATAGAADHHQTAGDIGVDQPLLLEHRIGGAADQRGKTLQRDAGATAGEITGGLMVVLETAMGQQGTAAFRLQADRKSVVWGKSV